MRPWPAVRALLIAVVLAWQWMDALPLPELSKSDLRYSIAQDELRRWSGLLTDMGVEMTPAHLAEIGLRMGKRATAFRRATMSPFRPLTRLTGIGQSWGLFAYPDPHAGRLVILTRTGSEEWQPRYQAPDPGTDRLSRRMRYRRVRGIYDDNGDRPRPGKLYDRFVDWVAWQIFEEDPTIDAVMVRLDLVRILTPSEGEAPPDKPRHARVRERDALTETLTKRWAR